MITHYFCANSHLHLLRYSLCPVCNGAIIGEVQAVSKVPPVPFRSHPWQLTRHDWAVLKAVGIDPQQERPVYG